MKENMSELLSGDPALRHEVGDGKRVENFREENVFPLSTPAIDRTCRVIQGVLAPAQQHLQNAN